MAFIFYVDIINRQFSDYFTKQMNLQEKNCTQTLCTINRSTNVKISTFLEKSGGMRLWITKWTFKSNNTLFNFEN